MSSGSKKVKTQAFKDFTDNTVNSFVEFYVEGLGWLIILKENIEIVSDNWFASTKYMASTMDIINEEAGAIKFTNVYKLNTSFTENAKNTKYNMMFDEIVIFSDKIVAFF